MASPHCSCSLLVGLGTFGPWIDLAGGRTAGWLTRYNDSVTLPNGFVLKRQFDFWFDDRDDMFAADGRTVLARDIEFLCFNDRFVEVTSYERGQGGLYDAKARGRVPRGKFEEMLEASGLSVKGKTCNGYFTGMLGAGLLYDGMTAPFLPPCAWRNLDKPTLSDPSWFERPCDESDPLGRGRSD
jgi:hypothetical protein